MSKRKYYETQIIFGLSRIYKSVIRYNSILLCDKKTKKREKYSHLETNIKKELEYD